jgi:hypothetical protein
MVPSAPHAATCTAALPACVRNAATSCGSAPAATTACSRAAESYAMFRRALHAATCTVGLPACARIATMSCGSAPASTTAILRVSDPRRYGGIMGGPGLQCLALLWCHSCVVTDFV